MRAEKVMYPGKILAVAFALTAAATVAGCGAGTAQSAAPTGTGPAASAAPVAPSVEHNAADVTFAQQMIPHHAQAVRMAELAPPRASSSQVRQLAAAIQAAQQPEIDQLTAMLTSWGAPVPPTAAADAPGMSGMSGMDHGSGMGQGATPGMMSDAEMAQLSQASGAAFDRQFLTMMIGHHQGAVQMSSVELTDGRDAEAKALARKITDAQRAEIDTMRQLLAG
jgi:uncharacterized protein (DUF305 family)